MRIHADLHTHSTASDGQYAPAELVRLARAAGIQLLALTDHDTLSGLDEAARAAQEAGLRFVRGAELAAREHKKLHILAYGFRAGPTPLSRLCRRLQQDRQERNERIFRFLAQKGVPLDPEEVAAPSRPAFARAMVARRYVGSVGEAFGRYLDTPEFYRLERPKPAAQVCIETVRASGGRTALAHPYLLRYGEEELERLVATLRACGLDAIECHYPSHTADQTARCLALARKYGLGVTAGSDFHGERVKPDVRLTPWPLEIPGLQTPENLL